MIWTRKFWLGAAERAVKTFFQAFVALIGTSAVVLSDVDWLFIVSGSALAAILSLATSIGSADFVAGEQLPKRAQTEPAAVGDRPPAELVPPAEHVTDLDVTRLTDWHDQHNGGDVS